MIALRGKNMLFIEAHAHVWKEIRGRRFDACAHTPLTLGRTMLGDTVTQFLLPEWRDCTSPVEVLQAYEEILGFDKCVLLQTPCYGPQYEYINAIMAKFPGKYVTVGVPNPQDKTSYMETARLCLGEYGYKGLKFECPDIPFDMTAPENAFVFETIRDYGAYCMVDMGWGDGRDDFPIDAMRTVVARYPDLGFIFPHLGVSRLWDIDEHKNNFPSLRKTLGMLETNRNVWFDLSGIPMLAGRAGEEYPWPSGARFLKVIREYGALDRVMWGSDYPGCLRAGTYRMVLESFTKHCDFLTDDELENIMGKTADRVWFGK